MSSGAASAPGAAAAPGDDPARPSDPIRPGAAGDPAPEPTGRAPDPGEALAQLRALGDPDRAAESARYHKTDREVLRERVSDPTYPLKRYHNTVKRELINRSEKKTHRLHAIDKF